ncbi:hypothetical protein OROMI_022015 [Orobanche minor]
MAESAEVCEASNDIEDMLYQYGKRLVEATEKSQNVSDYMRIIEAAGGSVKAKKIAAELIPKCLSTFRLYPYKLLISMLISAKMRSSSVRVQAILGIPLFCEDTVEHISKFVDVLNQLSPAGVNVERDAVQKSLMIILQQVANSKVIADGGIKNVELVHGLLEYNMFQKDGDFYVI